MKYLRIVLTLLFLTYSFAAFAANDVTDDMFGVWGSLTLQGDFKFIDPSLDKLHWQVMNQARTREDSAQGSRFTENLLFGQLGYVFNKHGSVWLGYMHDWIHPLNKPMVHENRPYQDFVWNDNFGDFKFMSRTRMEERINQTTGNVGYRPRQLLQLSHSLPFLDGLSAYLGDEVLFYTNKNTFGKKGFSENRVFSGLSYQATSSLGVDLGYLGQYVSTQTGHNLFTHNLQANVRYHF